MDRPRYEWGRKVLLLTGQVFDLKRAAVDVWRPAYHSSYWRSWSEEMLCLRKFTF
jgi:hypothetical protein